MSHLFWSAFNQAQQNESLYKDGMRLNILICGISEQTSLKSSNNIVHCRHYGITACIPSKSPKICIATHRRIIYVSPCLCVWHGGCMPAHVCVCVCDTSPAHVFERKSRLTICRRLPPQHHARLKLIVKCLLLANAWAGGAQGHSQGLATISDGLGGGGLVCHSTAVTPRILSHRRIFAAAKHHLNYL